MKKRMLIMFSVLFSLSIVQAQNTEIITQTDDGNVADVL